MGLKHCRQATDDDDMEKEVYRGSPSWESASSDNNENVPSAFRLSQEMRLIDSHISLSPVRLILPDVLDDLECPDNSDVSQWGVGEVVQWWCATLPDEALEFAPVIEDARIRGSDLLSLDLDLLLSLEVPLGLAEEVMSWIDALKYGTPAPISTSQCGPPPSNDYLPTHAFSSMLDPITEETEPFTESESYKSSVSLIESLTSELQIVKADRHQELEAEIAYLKRQLEKYVRSRSRNTVSRDFLQTAADLHTRTRSRDVWQRVSRDPTRDFVETPPRDSKGSTRSFRAFPQEKMSHTRSSRGSTRSSRGSQRSSREASKRAVSPFTDGSHAEKYTVSTKTCSPPPEEPRKLSCSKRKKSMPKGKRPKDKFLVYKEGPIDIGRVSTTRWTPYQGPTVEDDGREFLAERLERVKTPTDECKQHVFKEGPRDTGRITNWKPYTKYRQDSTEFLADRVPKAKPIRRSRKIKKLGPRDVRKKSTGKKYYTQRFQVQPDDSVCAANPCGKNSQQSWTSGDHRLIAMSRGGSNLPVL